MRLAIEIIVFIPVALIALKVAQDYRWAEKKELKP